MNLLKKLVPEKLKALIKSCRYNCLYRPILNHIEKKFNLIYLAQREAEKKFFQTSPTELKKILKGKKLSILDIGARGGPESEFAPYLDQCEFILVEPDPKEAQELREKNYHVIPSLLGEKVGTRILNIGQRGGTSSYYEPTGEFLELYTSGNSDRFNIVEKIELPMTTLEKVLDDEELKVDYIKLDTQGSELDILSGLNKNLPLFIKTEISFVPIYKDGALFFELGKFLYNKGYLMFHQTYYARSAPDKHLSSKRYEETVLPMHGDAWFCPDWTRENGKKMIQGRKEEFEALMNLFGMKHLYQYSKKYL